MRDELTGETRAGADEYAHGAESAEFFWTEGNWACDVNRYLDFYGDDADQDIDAGGHNCLLLDDGMRRRFTLLSLTYDGKELLT